jgi:hypothetical protein
MLSSNIATLTYVETRGVELRRQAAQSRLAKRVDRRGRSAAANRPTGV